MDLYIYYLTCNYFSFTEMQNTLNSYFKVKVKEKDPQPVVEETRPPSSSTLESDTSGTSRPATLLMSTPHHPNVAIIPSQKHIVKGKGKEIRFQSSWFEKYKWTHYDTETNGILCFTCLKAKERGLTNSSKCQDPAFTSVGFKNWKKALEKFSQHELSDSHRFAVSQIVHLAEHGNIDAHLNDQVKHQQQVAKKCLTIIFTSVQYLARQGLAFRGHTPDSGNFYQLLLVRCEDNVELSNWLKRKTDFTSPESQNEILSMFSHAIQHQIVNAIKKNTYFAIIIDGTQDIMGVEQESVCFRFVDEDLDPQEVFTGFYEMSETTGRMLAQMAKDVMLRLGLSIEDLRFQTYDGASNMSGQYNGCQAIIKAEQSLALYMHCGSHVTHLVSSYAANSVPLIRDALQHVQDLGTLYKSSIKLRNIFSAMSAELEPTGEKVGRIKPLCPTRWLSRCAAVNSVLSQYSHVIAALTSASNNISGEVATKARGLLSQFQKTSTLLSLKMAMIVMSLLEKLNKSLQSRSMTVSGMLQAVHMVEKQLTDLRCEDSFNNLYAKVEQQANDLDLDELNLPRKRKVPDRYTGSGESYAASNVSELYRVKFYEFIDSANGQLRERFQKNDLNIYGNLEAVLLSGKISSTEEVLLKRYPEIDTSFLQSELQIFHRQFGSNSNLNLSDVVKILKKMKPEVRSMIPSVVNLCRLLILSPAASVEAERSFSGLRRLKTWLRNSMSQQRLNSVAVCHTHQEILDQLKIDDLVDDYINKSSIRQKAFS